VYIQNIQSKYGVYLWIHNDIEDYFNIYAVDMRNTTRILSNQKGSGVNFSSNDFKNTIIRFLQQQIEQDNDQTWKNSANEITNRIIQHMRPGQSQSFENLNQLQFLPNSNYPNMVSVILKNNTDFNLQSLRATNQTTGRKYEIFQFTRAWTNNKIPEYDQYDQYVLYKGYSEIVAFPSSGYYLLEIVDFFGNVKKSFQKNIKNNEILILE
jgi:hypothetical protein